MKQGEIENSSTKRLVYQSLLCKISEELDEGIIVLQKVDLY